MSRPRRLADADRQTIGNFLQLGVVVLNQAASAMVDAATRDGVDLQPRGAHELEDLAHELRDIRRRLKALEVATRAGVPHGAALVKATVPA